MRRLVAVLAVMTIATGLLGVVPASATHGCTDPSCKPVTVIVIEGIGNVCSKARVSNPSYGTKCTYAPNDPTWVSKPASPWNQSGFSNGSKFQGLFWPGLGPGAVGPYELNIGEAVSPPANVCVSSIGGPGCKSLSEGILLPGVPTGVGAMCGSSHGDGTIKFTSADGTFYSEGTSSWDQSAATILPLHGTISKVIDGGVTTTYNASKPGPTLVGFTSSRGLGGSGNCGITDPTTGFQVEGMVVTY